MKRNLRALLLIVLVAVIVGVVLGVFLSGGDEEATAPATVASVESESAPAAKQVAEPEPAERETTQSAGAELETAQLEASQPKTAAPETAQSASDEPESAPGEDAEETQQAKLEAASRVQEEPSVARATPEEPSAETPEPALTPPSFDVVRVAPSGRAVIAGRAEPGSEVTVLDDGIAIGSVLADKRGEWVLVPDKSLGGGDRELSLVQALPNGEEMLSEQVVVLSVPVPREKPAAQALAAESGAPAEEAGGAAVLAEAEGAASVAEAEGMTPVAEAEGMAPVAEAEGAAPVAEAAAPVEEKIQEGVIAVLVEREGDGPSRILQSPEMAGEGIGDEADVTIRSVDYDAEGEVTLAGRTEPSAVVNVYVDEQYVGSAQASEEGEWQLSPEADVSPGQHRLRIDKVDDTGIVLARIETPISRARPEELLLGDALVVVQPGNSLWRIARRAYGGGIYYSEIYGANRAQILDPSMIFPGQILTLPVLN